MAQLVAMQGLAMPMQPAADALLNSSNTMCRSCSVTVQLPFPAFPGTCLTGQGASSSPFIAPSVAHAQSSSRCCRGGNATACSACHHQRTFGRREVAALKFKVAAAGTGAETAPM